MAVPTSILAVSYEGNGTTNVPYNIPFPFIEDSHIYVAIRAEGADTAEELDRGLFTVSRLEDGSGGHITTDPAVPSGAKLTIFRNVPLVQPTSFQPQGPFPSKSSETALDRLVMQIQQINRIVREHHDENYADDDVDFIAIPGNSSNIAPGVLTWDTPEDQPGVEPNRKGQLGVEISSQSVWIAQSTATGDWKKFADAIDLDAPEFPRRTVRVGFIADAGKKNDLQDQVAASLYAAGVEILLMAGDNNYDDPSQIGVNTAAFNAMQEVYTAEGNHDLQGDNGAAQRLHFSDRPSSPGHLPGCFVATIADGLIDLIVLQSGLNNGGTQTVTGGVGLNSPMHTWFLDELKKLKAPHRLVMFHHPSWAPLNEVGTDLDWPWDLYGVNAVLNGHNHLSYLGWKKGVCYLNAGATTRLDGELSPTLHGKSEGAWVEWAETEDICSCVFQVTPNDIRHEWIDGDGRVRHSGSIYTPSPAAFLVDSDVWAPDEPLHDDTRYITHAPGAFFPETIHASLVDDRDSSIELQILIDNSPLFSNPVTVNGDNRFDRESFSEGWLPKIVLDRQRIEAQVTVNGGYGAPPLGLRIALGGRRITT